MFLPVYQHKQISNWYSSTKSYPLLLPPCSHVRFINDLKTSLTVCITGALRYRRKYLVRILQANMLFKQFPKQIFSHTPETIPSSPKSKSKWSSSALGHGGKTFWNRDMPSHHTSCTRALHISTDTHLQVSGTGSTLREASDKWRMYNNTFSLPAEWSDG